MSFVLFSLTPEKGIASISFSGNQLSKFGFNSGSNVIVDISEGQIVIKPIDNNLLKTSNNCNVERNDFLCTE